jgi:hypothetical protein
MDYLSSPIAKGLFTGVLELALVGLLGAAAALWARSWTQRGKIWIKTGAGRVCMSPFVMLVGMLCGAAAAAALALGLLYPNSLQEPGELTAWLGLVGGFTLLSLAVVPFAWQTWEWDRDGLRWQGAWRPVSMRWAELNHHGKTWDGRSYVADKTGRRIYWSDYTLEHEALARAIRQARPDLGLPER